MKEIEVRGAIERLENPNATAWFCSHEDDVKTVIEFAKLHMKCQRMQESRHVASHVPELSMPMKWRMAR